ncbi:MAG: 2-succinyl-5-enolpyruvyl-6-hydroxy-3-cyclohexene-1-carboxylic-acid synthase [Cytophagaceae bacterium]|nr:2-succinyl-5-enolpyruvyl-6-hydroxy-3-cyclohexene-1-carboxylic-acid synthase [Cytophagaceae bacterium]
MQSIFNIAEICAQKNIKDIVLSPGSRCAPLTLAFVRHPEINTRTISDERSAAFIAIGISQQTKKTVGLICTSGSAAYNYAPAVAEAYYQQIPLLILTADRPPEWIDQLDGQTIRQNGIYGRHVKASFVLSVDQTHPDSQWETVRIINEAINLTQEFPCGPVHVNIPLREPLYSDNIQFDKNVKIINRLCEEKILGAPAWENLHKEFNQAGKKLIVCGQSDYDELFNSGINNYTKNHKIPVISDIISNFRGEKIIQHHDMILSGKDESLKEQLRPDLLITFGKSVISKNLKLFLRKYKPKSHWHIQPGGYVADTFKSLTKHIPVTAEYFIKNLMDKGVFVSNEKYFEQWQQEEQKARSSLQNFLSKEKTFTEFHATHQVLESLPQNSALHLANSMPVRYANYISSDKKNLEVFANRGTSGIDGVISTAVGAALSTEKTVTVLTGDMAFFYDRNALWNNYLPSNLRIVILNNHGGGIFRIIDGPNKQPELDEYFETKQKLITENTAKDHNLEYIFCKDSENLKEALKSFFNVSSISKILEVETGSKINAEIFQKFKNTIN